MLSAESRMLTVSFLLAHAHHSGSDGFEFAAKPGIEFVFCDRGKIDESHPHAAAVAGPDEFAFGFERAITSGQLKTQRHWAFHIWSMAGGERQATLADIGEWNRDVADRSVGQVSGSVDGMAVVAASFSHYQSMSCTYAAGCAVD